MLVKGQEVHEENKDHTVGEVN